MKLYRQMTTYYRLILFPVFLSIPALAIGAESKSVRLDCAALKMSRAPNQRVQLGSPPFSILPPQGENWCSYALPGGASFFKAPATVEVPATSLTNDEVLQIILGTVRFFTMAMTISNFGTDPTAPGQLKIVVDDLISKHFFSQILGGLISAERSFQLLDSQSALDNSSGLSCVRFSASVEARTVLSVKPVILNLKFLDNKVCIHPQSVGLKSTLVWIGFATLAEEKTPPSENNVIKEVEPFLRSLEFVITG